MARLEQSEATPAVFPRESAAVAATSSSQQIEERSLDLAAIGKSLIVKGELTGSESLFIDGKVEGAINLPGNRVTVGRNARVEADIVAREIVVFGKVRGNCQASDRVDIRSEGSLTGNVIAVRLSIEDGAFFKGDIDLRKPSERTNSPTSSKRSHEIAKMGSALADTYDLEAEREIAQGQYQTVDGDLEDSLPRARSAVAVLSHSRTA